MSYLKINSDSFLGKQELNRLVKSLDEDGFRKLFLKNSVSFGIFKNELDGNWDDFQVSQGTNAGTIKINEGFAVDNDGKIIYYPTTDNISLTDNGSYYWIKISHSYDSREIGTVSIDAQGNLTGGGTEFLKVLRGRPNNPVRVKFSNSSYNTQEYETVEVTSDNNALLAGNFVTESNLKLIVVGAFTPGIIVPSGSKEIHQYDGANVTYVLETVSNTPPALVEDEEFLIARVRRVGSAITIQDKRSLNIYKNKSDYELNKELISNNPLIGIEAVKYNNNLTTREENLVFLAWTFRSSNWTIDSSANRCTLITGIGGKFKSTTDFTDGDFDGWRLYTKDGNFSIIKLSSLVGGQINLILDSLNPDLFLDTAQQLIVSPNAESIELIFSANPSDATTLTDKKINLPINLGQVQIPIVVYKSASCLYNVRYRYISFNTASEAIAIPSDTVNGYYVEASYNADGVLTGTTKQTYTSHATNGFITLVLATNAYSNRIDSLETGDLFGIEKRELQNSNPVVDLTVGSTYQTQYIRTLPLVDGGLGSPYTFTTDHYFNLKTTGSAKAGNSFKFIFSGNIDDLTSQYIPSGYTIYFTQDYINSGDVGTIIYTLIGGDATNSEVGGDFQAMLDSPLEFICTFDGTNWNIVRSQKFVGRLVVDGGSSNARIEIGNKEANTTPYIDFNSHGSSANDYDVRVIASGGTNNVDGQGVLNILASELRVNGLPVTTGAVSTSRNVIAGSGLAGGGDLSADRTFDVNVDGSTIEISADTLRVKDSGITAAKISTAVAGAGLSGGAGTALAVNVDSSSIEISADTVRLPNGYKAVQSPDTVQLYTKVLTIGDWAINLSASVDVAHGLSDWKKIRSIDVVIRNDADSSYYHLSDTENDGTPLLKVIFNSTNINVALPVIGGTLPTGGNFVSTGYNRGWITIHYQS